MPLDQDIACAAANPNAGLVPATGVCHGRRAAPGPNSCRGYAVASCRPGAGRDGRRRAARRQLRPAAV